MSNYELYVPNIIYTKFRIGSMTKQFTAVAILQLTEKGLLGLQDTLSIYINDFPKGDKVTIHHLLTHTSGIFNSTSSKNFENTMRNPHSVIDLIEEFKNEPFDFEPGTSFLYSNSGYILLGYIIEKVSGMSYEDYLRENIFEKFSMNDTGYDNYRKLIKDRTSGYSIMGEDNKLINCPFIDMSIPYAAGAIYSTINDIHIWNNKLFSYSILNKNTLDKMLSKHAKTEDRRYYGYGLFIEDVKVNEKIIKKVSHGGVIPGFQSANRVFPNENIQLTMLGNILSPSLPSKVNDIESLILKGIFDNN